MCKSSLWFFVGALAVLTMLLAAEPARTSSEKGYYKRLGKEAGFEIGENKVVDQWFFLELKKPSRKRSARLANLHSAFSATIFPQRQFTLSEVL